MTLMMLLVVIQSILSISSCRVGTAPSGLNELIETT